MLPLSSSYQCGLWATSQGVAIGVGEIAGVAVPEGFLRGLEDLGVRLARGFESGIHLGFGADMARQRDAAEARRAET
jgi:hypothetical protein